MLERADGGSRGSRIPDVADYQSANAKVDLVRWPVPDLEVISSRFRGAPTFCSLDLLRSYWLMPPVEEVQDLSTNVFPPDLYIPSRVPQGALNAAADF